MLGKNNGVDVRLSIYSLAVHGEEKQEQRQEPAAQLFQKGNADYIRYVEELKGLRSVSTTVKVEDSRVTLIRHGAIKMNHIYRLGEKTTSMYQTAQGALEMEAETTRLEYIPLAPASPVASSVYLDSRVSCATASIS